MILVHDFFDITNMTYLDNARFRAQNNNIFIEKVPFFLIESCRNFIKVFSNLSDISSINYNYVSQHISKWFIYHILQSGKQTFGDLGLESIILKFNQNEFNQKVKYVVLTTGYEWSHETDN